MSTNEALIAARDALEEIALAGMSGTGQESEEGMRDWHARRAWEFIGIAARALELLKAALAVPAPAHEQAAETLAAHASLYAYLRRGEYCDFDFWDRLWGLHDAEFDAAVIAEMEKHGAAAQPQQATLPASAKRQGGRCACEPSGSDGLTCPGADGRPLCAQPQADAAEPVAAGLTKRERDLLNFCVANMDGLDDKDWRDHGFRRTTFDSLGLKLSKHDTHAQPAPQALGADADGKVLRAVEVLRNDALNRYRTSSAAGYKIHDLYRMELDAILAAATTGGQS